MFRPPRWRAYFFRNEGSAQNLKCSSGPLNWQLYIHGHSGYELGSSPQDRYHTLFPQRSPYARVLPSCSVAPRRPFAGGDEPGGIAHR